jgi:hypothetical protein
LLQEVKATDASRQAAARKGSLFFIKTIFNSLTYF